VAAVVVVHATFQRFSSQPPDRRPSACRPASSAVRGRVTGIFLTLLRLSYPDLGDTPKGVKGRCHPLVNDVPQQGEHRRFLTPERLPVGLAPECLSTFSPVREHS
jgi:hypothetical protein